MRKVQSTACGDAEGKGGVEAGGSLLAGTITAANVPDCSGVAAGRELSVGTWGCAVGLGLPEEMSQQDVPLATA